MADIDGESDIAETVDFRANENERWLQLRPDEHQGGTVPMVATWGRSAWSCSFARPTASSPTSLPSLSFITAL